MPRRFYILVTLATLAGAVLRLWDLAHVPPGLHYDLAATALLGDEVAFHGYRPIFITAYTGHEVLFYYWLALWFRLIGSSVFALRLAAALLGILAIPAAFFAVRQALRFDEHGLTLAAFAAVLLSFAFFHVTFSRFGFRVISQPVVQALALGFLFRGLHRMRLASARAWVPDIAAAGVFTGLAAYTYLAARLFPVPLAVFWIVLLIGARRSASFKLYAAGLGVFGLAAVLAFAPLGAYFLRNPGDFLNRAGQVVPRPGESQLLLQGIRRAAEMIFVDGEPYDRFNIPGQPLFGPVLGIFFVVGLLVTVRRLFAWPRAAGRREPLALRAAAEAMLLAWVPAMLVPTALSVHDIFPSNVRAFGLIPLLFIFPARGILAAYRGLQSIWPGPLIPYAYPVTVLALVTLAAGSYTTYRDYFGTWANLPNQHLNNDADLTAIAAYLNSQDLGEAAAFVSAIHYRHPSLAYLARDFERLRWLTGGTSLAIPAEGPALYLFARSAPPPEDWIAGWDAHLRAAPPGPDGVPDFRAYRFEAGERPPLPDFDSLSENFGNTISLTGYRLLPEPDRLLVDLRWRVDNLPEANDLLPYARLSDAWENVWAQSGGFSYPSEQWMPGDVLLTRLSVRLPSGMPPGEYTVKVGMYSAGSQTGLPRLSPQGSYAGERAPLPEVRLSGGPPIDAQRFLDSNPVSAPAERDGLAAGLELLGYHLSSAEARQGERVQLTLYWRAESPLGPANLQISLGEQTLYEGQPVRGTYPFSEWQAGQIVADRHSLKIPAGFPPGPAGLRLSVAGFGSAQLAPLEVVAVERGFSPPAPPVDELGYDYGGVIGLYGYRLEPGRPARLTLYWRALADIERDYTVFVHVLDESGQIAAQADAHPRGGAYPTSLWAPGEFVEDAYVFDLAPGKYRAAVGLYLAEDGARLGVLDRAGSPSGDAVWLEAFEVP